MKKILIVEDKEEFQMRVAYSILAAIQGHDDLPRELDDLAWDEVDPSLEFQKLGYELKITAFAPEGKNLLKDHDFEMISLDGTIFDGHGRELLELIPEADHVSKVLLFSGDLNTFQENFAHKLRKGGCDSEKNLIKISKQILNL